MLNKVKESDDYVAICQNDSVRTLFFGAVAVIAIGWYFFTLPLHADTFFIRVHAIVMLILGIFLIWKIIVIWFKQSPESKVILKIQSDRLEHNPLETSKPIVYDWSDISKFILTEKIRHRRGGKVVYSKNLVLVLFNKAFDDGLFERSRLQRHLASNGDSYLAFQVSKKELKTLYQILLDRYPDVTELKFCQSVVFDYSRSKIVFSN